MVQHIGTRPGGVTDDCYGVLISMIGTIRGRHHHHHHHHHPADGHHYGGGTKPLQLRFKAHSHAWTLQVLQGLTGAKVNTRKHNCDPWWQLNKRGGAVHLHAIATRFANSATPALFIVCVCVHLPRGPEGPLPGSASKIMSTGHCGVSISYVSCSAHLAQSCEAIGHVGKLDFLGRP